VVIAARDSAIPEVARVLHERGLVPHESVVVHCAGALDHTVLAAVRPSCKGVAQMHPMISFADPKQPPSMLGGHAHVSGDPEAVPLYVACAMAQLPMARALGDARPLAFDEVEHVLVEASSKVAP